MSESDGQQVVHPARVEALSKKIGTTDGTNWEDDLEADLWTIMEKQQKTINELANQIVDLTEEVEELSAAVENDSYEQLTREQKRLRVKRLVQNAAKENGGRGAVDYGEIRALFNKKIPGGSAHYLMEQIGEDRGYQYDKRDQANDVLKVDLSETEEEFFSSE